MKKYRITYINIAGGLRQKSFIANDIIHAVNKLIEFNPVKKIIKIEYELKQLEQL